MPVGVVEGVPVRIAEFVVSSIFRIKLTPFNENRRFTATVDALDGFTRG
jgi:hypothetical protein